MMHAGHRAYKKVIKVIDKVACQSKNRPGDPWNLSPVSLR